eukprot:TRINITY_DN36969_c0_g1_i1.p1 TRINITY_DN36969_c0_g1~~TRINITY_DN36969_c0_g1_i1.p1  ORF type:complete len:271 (+),score=56.78 TRINITY_DN36969_c0_g1_i1:57-815(+)
MAKTLEGLLFRSKTASYIVGGGLFGYASWNTYRFYDSKNWYRVDGRVLAMYPYTAWLGDDKERFLVDYTFEYEGEQRFGVAVESGTVWRWWMGSWLRDSVGQNEILRCNMRPGGSVKVMVNPRNPRDCALLRLPDSTRNGALMGWGATLAIVAFFSLPAGHKFPILEKMRWVWRRRVKENSNRTKIIDVVFDREPETQAWRYPENSGYKPNVGLRQKMGLTDEVWDNDVQRMKQERIEKDRQREQQGTASLT